jgi:hypothetical protein
VQELLMEASTVALAAVVVAASEEVWREAAAPVVLAQQAKVLLAVRQERELLRVFKTLAEVEVVVLVLLEAMVQIPPGAMAALVYPQVLVALQHSMLVAEGVGQIQGPLLLEVMAAAGLAVVLVTVSLVPPIAEEEAAAVV